MEKLEKQQCPLCGTKNLTLTESEEDIPYFGKVLIFSMDCSNCNFSKSDIESLESKEPSRYTIEINSEEDLKIRIVKSSEATIKIPQLRMSMTPGPASIGFVSNIEGILSRFEKIIEDEYKDSEDDETKKHAKNLLKKIRKIKFGDVPLKIIIEDPSGNSAIISQKAKIEKIKK